MISLKKSQSRTLWRKLWGHGRICPLWSLDPPLEASEAYLAHRSKMRVGQFSDSSVGIVHDGLKMPYLEFRQDYYDRLTAVKAHQNWQWTTVTDASNDIFSRI